MNRYPKVFLHGWGQSEAIWIAQKHRYPDAQFINLPGHGGAAEAAADQWLNVLNQQLPQSPHILIGWSLGGMLALELASKLAGEPGRIAGLGLVGSTPSFVARASWPHGCDAATFSAFKQSIEAPEKERNRAMSRFFALMLQGDELPRRAFNQLARQGIDRQHPASCQGLEAGLLLLETLDLRDRLTAIKVPTLVMHGDADAIVPVAAGKTLSKAMPAADWKSYERTGHAPFLTRPDTFNEALEAWCKTL